MGFGDIPYIDTPILGGCDGSDVQRLSRVASSLLCFCVASFGSFIVYFCSFDTAPWGIQDYRRFEAEFWDFGFSSPLLHSSSSFSKIGKSLYISIQHLVAKDINWRAEQFFYQKDFGRILFYKSFPSLVFILFLFILHKKLRGCLGKEEWMIEMEGRKPGYLGLVW